MRWKGRLGRGQPAVRQPGPAPGRSLVLAHLEEEIQALRHGRKRSAGVGPLWQRHRGQISRRRLQGLVADVRSQEKRQGRNALQRLATCARSTVTNMKTG